MITHPRAGALNFDAAVRKYFTKASLFCTLENRKKEKMTDRPIIIQRADKARECH